MCFKKFLIISIASLILSMGLSAELGEVKNFDISIDQLSLKLYDTPPKIFYNIFKFNKIIKNDYNETQYIYTNNSNGLVVSLQDINADSSRKMIDSIEITENKYINDKRIRIGMNETDLLKYFGQPYSTHPFKKTSNIAYRLHNDMNKLIEGIPILHFIFESNSLTKIKIYNAFDGN